MIRPILFLLACVDAGAAHSQTFLSLTLGERPPDDRPPTSTRAPDPSLIQDTYPDLCILEWDFFGDRLATAFADGCDGPILSLVYDNGIFSGQTGTALPGLTFGGTTLSELSARFGSEGLTIGSYGATEPSILYSLAYPIEDEPGLAVFHFFADFDGSGFNTAPEARPRAKLTALGFIKPNFLSVMDANGAAIDPTSVSAIPNPFVVSQ